VTVYRVSRCAAVTTAVAVVVAVGDTDATVKRRGGGCPVGGIRVQVQIQIQVESKNAWLLRRGWIGPAGEAQVAGSVFVRGI
jgi:hypothetical protein